MSGKKKVILIVIGSLVGLVLLFVICRLIFVGNASSDVKRDRRYAADAAEKGLSVEQARPSTKTGARFLAEHVRSEKVDTVFLGYWLGMSEKEYRIETTKNIRAGKLSRINGYEFYKMKLFDGSTSRELQMFILPYFYKDSLYMLNIAYSHSASSRLELALPYESAIEVIDGVLREKYEEEGRLRYPQGYPDLEFVYYYMGNTETRLMKANDITRQSYAIRFQDCYVARLREAELDAIEDAENERERSRGEQTMRDTAGDF